jgi:hypothetical protein
LLVAAPSVVVPFVPFACNISPVGIVQQVAVDKDHLDREGWMLLLVAAGLILGALPFLWRAWAMWRRESSAGPRISANTVGLLMCATALGVIGTSDPGLADFGDPFLFGPILLMASGLLSWWLLRRCWNPDERALGILIVGYVSHGGLSVLMFARGGLDDLKVGWYLTACCVAGSIAEFIAMAVGALRQRARPPSWTEPKQESPERMRTGLT